MMESLIEQPVCVKSCFPFSKNVAETVLLLETVYKDEAIEKT